MFHITTGECTSWWWRMMGFEDGGPGGDHAIEPLLS